MITLLRKLTFTYFTCETCGAAGLEDPKVGHHNCVRVEAWCNACQKELWTISASTLHVVRGREGDFLAFWRVCEFQVGRSTLDVSWRIQKVDRLRER